MPDRHEDSDFKWQVELPTNTVVSRIEANVLPGMRFARTRDGCLLWIPSSLQTPGRIPRRLRIQLRPIANGNQIRGRFEYVPWVSYWYLGISAIMLGICGDFIANAIYVSGLTGPLRPIYYDDRGLYCLGAFAIIFAVISYVPLWIGRRTTRAAERSLRDHLRSVFADYLSDKGAPVGQEPIP